MHRQKLQRAAWCMNLTVTNARLNKRGKEKKGGEAEPGRTESKRAKSRTGKGRRSLIKDGVETAE